jgi:hypothetical protein
MKKNEVKTATLDVVEKVETINGKRVISLDDYPLLNRRGIPASRGWKYKLLAKNKFPLSVMVTEHATYVLVD